MGLLDSYFDPDQFQASGGLLGRLLSLPQMQGLYQPGADDLDQAPSAPPMPPPRPNLQSDGQPSSNSQTAAPDLHSQYQALRPVLGDRNAMLATVNPDIGRMLIAQALTGRQESGNTGDADRSGSGQSGLGNQPSSAAGGPPAGLSKAAYFEIPTNANQAFRELSDMRKKGHATQSVGKIMCLE
jgi:hypothetical protein